MDISFLLNIGKLLILSPIQFGNISNLFSYLLIFLCTLLITLSTIDLLLGISNKLLKFSCSPIGNCGNLYFSIALFVFRTYG